MTVISIIGAGNMGSSLIGGLIKHGHPPQNIFATDASAEKLEHMHQAFHIHTTTDNLKAVESADVVIFAIKPQVFAEVARPLASVMQSKKPLVISIAAGVRIDSIEHWLGGNLPVVRAMPNTPALIGAGATALFPNKLVGTTQLHLAETILKAVGIVTIVNNESLMDAVTAVSGSGPAYFFLVMEAMEQAGIELGLNKETAKQLTLQTALGAARMAIENTIPLADLRKQVTSPGGTTEKAVSVLEQHKLREIFKEALAAASHRSEELADLLKGK